MGPITLIQDRVDAASAALKAFPKGPMGLTPDAVKALPEYQAAKREYAVAFAALRAANATKSRA